MLILGGALSLYREEFTPVRSSPQGQTFPVGAAVPLAKDEPTLILFAHPLCPCTRATLHELADILGEARKQVSVVIVFSIAPGIPSNWKDGDLWMAAKRLSGVQVLQDLGGKESRSFGVNGSGQCLLYSSSGNLLFCGGITAARGHEGENPGRLAVVDLINTGKAGISRTPVFGCSLL